MDEIGAIIPNAEKTAPATWGLKARPAEAPGIAGQHPRLRRHPERLRPSLHLLHHPVRARRSRSVPPAAVVAEVQALVASGHREVVLTGVDLTSWGADLPDRPRLGALVAQQILADCAGPREGCACPPSIVAEIEPISWAPSQGRGGSCPTCISPLQSGNDRSLKRMKRRHSACRRDPPLPRNPPRPDLNWSSAPISLPAFPPKARLCSEDTLAPGWGTPG